MSEDYLDKRILFSSPLSERFFSPFPESLEVFFLCL